jgi:hypothetical protein
MISRRRMLGSSAAVSALGLGNVYAKAAASSRSATRASAPIHCVVVDQRFEAAQALAGDLAPGARRIVMPRDVLELWHRQLAPVCRNRQHAIAGVTTERGFFLLRTLAAEHRLRVLSRAVHGGLVSWVIGPK